MGCAYLVALGTIHRSNHRVKHIKHLKSNKPTISASSVAPAMAINMVCVWTSALIETANALRPLDKGEPMNALSVSLNDSYERMIMKLKFALFLPVLIVAFMSTFAFAEDQDYKQAELDWHKAIKTFMQEVKVAEGFDYDASENSNLWTALDIEVKRLANERENVNKGTFFFLCEAHKKVMRQFYSASYDPIKLSGICASSGLAVEDLVSQGKNSLADSELEKLQEEALKGDAYAQYQLGEKYFFGDGLPKDAAKAVEWYQKAATQGHAASQYSLGVMYGSGEGVQEDAAKAVGWYHKAAAQGHPVAQYHLGVRYGNGYGVPKDVAKAIEWYHKAAAQGYARAQFNLGVMYKNGEGVPKGTTKAFEWFQKAADQGHAEAQMRLGAMYFSGEGVLKDFTKAAEWFQKAATKGDAPAQAFLGLMYFKGDGVPRDADKAFEWSQKSAAQGYADGQFRLGLLYLLGERTSENMIRAYAWINLAAAQGHKEAKKQRVIFESLLNSAQRAESQRLASNWKSGDTFKTVRTIPNSQIPPVSAPDNSAPSQKNTGGSASWKSFHKTNGAEYFIDTNSIRKAGGLTYAWETVEVDMVDENNTKVRQTMVINNVINCNTHRVASGSIKLIVRNENGDVIKNGTLKADESEFLAVEPDSPGDKLIAFACTANVGAPTGGSSNSSGSGFFVSPGGYLLTNNHVVNGCANLKIRDSSKIEHDVTVVATDARNDLALIKMVKPVALSAATFRANASVESGESIVALGYPLAGILASEVNVSFGYVSATAGLADDTSKLQISAPVQPGNSGGPLLDQSGNLIGVVVAKLDAVKVAKAIGDIPQNINFAVKGEVAQTFLNAHKVKFKTATSTKKLENTDIASRGRAFTVLVECYK